MASRQTFGWTQLEQAPPDKYVKFVTTVVDESGTLTLSVRDDDCRYVSIALPREAREELARALMLGADGSLDLRGGPK